MKYTKEFERYWGRCDHTGYSFVSKYTFGRIKERAFSAWQAARRGRI